MSARSSLTVVSGTTITSAWGNGVRDHVVPKTTSNDVSSEGQLAVNTSSDRLVVHDGSAAVRLMGYSEAGRTYVWSTGTASTVGSGAYGQTGFSAVSDDDGFYTGLSGGTYKFTVPTGLGGLYLITLNYSTGTAMSATGYSVLTCSGSGAATFAAPSGVGGTVMTCTAITVLAAGDTFSGAVYNGHSSSLTFTASIVAHRLCP